MKKKLLISILSMSITLLTISPSLIKASVVTPSTSTISINSPTVTVATGIPRDLQKSNSSMSAVLNTACVGDLQYRFYQDGTAEVIDKNYSTFLNVTSLTIPSHVVNPQDNQTYQVTDVLPYTINYFPNLVTLNIDDGIYLHGSAIYYDDKLETINVKIQQDFSKVVLDCPKLDQTIITNSKGLTCKIDIPVGYYIVIGQYKYVVEPNYTLKFVKWFPDNTTNTIDISSGREYRGVDYTVTSIASGCLDGENFSSATIIRMHSSISSIEPNSISNFPNLIKVEVPYGIDMSNVVNNCPNLPKYGLSIINRYIDYNEVLVNQSHINPSCDKTVTKNNVSYNLMSDGTAYLTGCNLQNNESSVSIEPFIIDQSTGKSYKVTTLTTGSFKNLTNLKSVTLPDTVVYIQSGAFNNDSNLSKLSVFNKTFIDSLAIKSCPNLDSSSTIIRQEPTTVFISTATSSSTIATDSSSTPSGTNDINYCVFWIILLISSLITLIGIKDKSRSLKFLYGGKIK